MASPSGGGVYASSVERQISSACCISGAIQHIAGCSGAKHIIVITTDPGAPMMSRADYTVIGDLHEVIPALIKALRAREIDLQGLNPSLSVRFVRVLASRIRPMLAG